MKKLMFFMGFLALANFIHSQTVQAILQETGVQGGLAIHLGVTDGKLTTELNHGEKFLVHGLALSDEQTKVARSYILSQNKYGLVSVETKSSMENLPYHSELANLLVADLNALGDKAPSRDEILRVLAPGGVAYVNDGGWKTYTRELPEKYDEWSHFDYGPQGNAISKDLQVSQKTSVKWIDWYQRSGFGRRHFMGYRTSNGIAIHETRFRHDIDGNRQDGEWMVGRDAYNGLPLWYKPADNSTSEVVVDGNVAYMLKPQGMDKVIQMDIRTGEVLKEYDNSIAAEEGIRDPGRVARLVFFNKTIFQAAQKSVVAINPDNGAEKWRFTEPASRRLTFMQGSPEEKKIFVVATSEEGGWSRWPGEPSSAVICLHAETGAELWRNTDVNGKYIGNLVYDNGKLVVFNAYGIGASPSWYDKDEDGDRGPQSTIGLLNTENGQTLWLKRYNDDGLPAKGSFMFAPFVKDGKIHLADQEERYEMGMDGSYGEKRGEKRISNQRCNRPRGTERYFITGFGIMQEWDPNGYYMYQELTRSDCAGGSWPSYGMQYFGPNECNCFVMLRGHAAYASFKLNPPIEDEKRLEVFSGSAPEFKEVKWVKTSRKHDEYPREEKNVPDPREYRSEINSRPQFTGSLIRDSWVNNDFIPGPETDKTVSGNRTFVAVVNEHRLEAREGGNVVWSFTANARISRAPEVYNGKVYIGAHDGYVYALNQSDGKLIWRFFAAANQKKMMAYGQLESAWPLFGVVVHSGTVIASAGRHPEVDHGLFIWGLDAETGAAQWKTKVYTMAEWRQNGNPPEQTFYNWTINRQPTVSSSGIVEIPGVTIDPSEAGAPLNLAEAPMEKIPEELKVFMGSQLRIVIPNSIKGQAEIKILNMQGKTIATSSWNGSGNINFAPENFQPGTYLVVVKHQAGKLVKDFRIAAK